MADLQASALNRRARIYFVAVAVAAACAGFAAWVFDAGQGDVAWYTAGMVVGTAFQLLSQWLMVNW